MCCIDPAIAFCGLPENLNTIFRAPSWFPVYPDPSRESPSNGLAKNLVRATLGLSLLALCVATLASRAGVGEVARARV